MPELTPRKQMTVIRSYFHGNSYQDIAQKSGVSKGSVSNIISVMKSGQLPALRDIEDQVDTLRELAVQLNRNGLSLPQAAIGLSAFQGIAALGVSPGEIGKVVALCRSLTPDGLETGPFVEAALALVQTQDRTGKSPEELESWVNELEERANALGAQCQELQPIAQQIETLRSQRDGLVQENAALASEVQRKKQELEKAISCLKQDLERLESQVRDSQGLISEMGRRYLDREEELRQVEHRLAGATRAIGELTDLGLPLEQLPDMAARLHRQARQQGVEPDRFLDWFYFCLDGAGSLLALDSLVKAKREQLQEADRELREVTKKQDAATAAIRGLGRQMAEDKASRRSIIAAWKEEIRVVAQTIRQEVTHGEEGLRALANGLEQEVREGLVQIRKTAVSLGRLEESVNSYAIVRPLVSLLQGKNQLSLPEARIAATALCLGLLGYLERNPEIAGASLSVGQRTKYLLEALETWHP